MRVSVTLNSIKNPQAKSDKKLENRQVDEEGRASTGPLSLNMCMLLDKNNYKFALFWLLA